MKWIIFFINFITKNNMKKILAFVFILTSLTAYSQLLHLKSMRYFSGDLNSPLVNVFDVNKESLIKSINCGETVVNSRLCFNKEETKIYKIGLRYASVIDVATLEAEKIKLLSDEDTLVQNTTKLMAMIEAERNRVLKEIENSNLDAKFTETPEIIKMKALPLLIISLGVSESGIVVSERLFTDKIELNVYDLKQAGKKVNTFDLPAGSDCTMHEGNILVFVQDGSINIVDPITGKNIGKIGNAIDAKDLAEAKIVTAGYDNKNIRVNLSSYGKYLITSLNLGMIPNTATIKKAFSIYNFATKTIVYSSRGIENSPSIMPIYGTELFQKVVAKTPMPVLQLPEPPDFTKYTAKDIKNGTMTKASVDYEEKVKTSQAEWKLKFDAYNNPQNFATKIYSDINATQELLSIDAARYVGIKGDYIICLKDLGIEFYDLKTKSLVHTIYNL